eukprot:Nk52_evm11s684 gene=Nk52_evmTU11s684
MSSSTVKDSSKAPTPVESSLKYVNTRSTNVPQLLRWSSRHIFKFTLQIMALTGCMCLFAAVILNLSSPRSYQAWGSIGETVESISMSTDNTSYMNSTLKPPLDDSLLKDVVISRKFGLTLKHNYVFGMVTVARPGKEQILTETLLDLVKALECDFSNRTARLWEKKPSKAKQFCVPNWKERTKILIYNSETIPEKHKSAIDDVHRIFPDLIHSGNIIIVNRTEHFAALFKDPPPRPSYSKYNLPKVNHTHLKLNEKKAKIRKQSLNELNIIPYETAVRGADDGWYRIPFADFEKTYPFTSRFVYPYAVRYSKQSLDVSFAMNYALKYIKFKPVAFKNEKDDTDDGLVNAGPSIYIHMDDDVESINGVNPVGAVEAMITCLDISEECPLHLKNPWLLAWIQTNERERGKNGLHAPLTILQDIFKVRTYGSHYWGSLGVMFKLYKQQELFQEYIWFLYSQYNREPYDIQMAKFETGMSVQPTFHQAVGLFYHKGTVPSSQPKNGKYQSHRRQKPLPN